MYGCQLPLWLTVNFTDLCVSVYTYTTNAGVAPALPLWYCAIVVAVGAIWRRFAGIVIAFRLFSMAYGAFHWQVYWCTIIWRHPCHQQMQCLQIDTVMLNGRAYPTPIYAHGHMANPLILLHCHIDIITHAFLFVANSMAYFISAKFFECALFVPHSYSIIQPSQGWHKHDTAQSEPPATSPRGGKQGASGNDDR